MAIITLTTDFGEKDHFVGAVKGAIYSELEDVKIVDISHLISPFHLHEASYIIQNAYKSFPKGTIHIIGVDSELNPENKHIAVYMDDHYFICADNGIISMLTSEIRPEKIEEMTKIRHIVNKNENQIIGNVIYIDNYGNAISNISKKQFDQVGHGRKFVIGAKTTKIMDIYASYSDAINFDLPSDKREEGGKKLALWNSSGYLELAIYKSNPSSVGGASSLFGLNFLDSVTINFEPES